jgi:hypothetical protein
MDQNYDTKVKDWFIIQLMNEDEEQLAEVLWGIAIALR